MKKLKIVANSRAYELFIPVILDSDKTRMQKFLIMLKAFQKYLFYFFLLFLPSSYLLLSNQSIGEQPTFNFILLIVLFLVGTLLSIVSLNGFKSFTDPVGLFPVLFFAVTSTFLSVVASFNENLSAEELSQSTFGTDKVTLVTGLSIVSFLTIYYVYTLLIRNLSHVRKTLSLLFLGFTFVFLMMFFRLVSFDQALIYTYVILFYPLVLAFSLFQNKFRLLALVTSFFTFFVLMQIVNFDRFDTRILVAFLISSLVSLVTIDLVYINHRFENTFSKFGETKDLLFDFSTNLVTKGQFVFKTILDTLYLALNILALFAPFVIIAILAIAFMQDNNLLNSFSLTLTTFSKDISSVFETGNIVYILFGQGFESSGVSSSQSLINNIFNIQGLVGLIAYVSIFIYGIFLSVKNLNRLMQMDNEAYKFSSIVTFFVISIPIFSIFVYSGIAMLAIWWILFALNCVLARLIDNNFNSLGSYTGNYKIDSIKLKQLSGKRGFYFRLLLSILFIVATLALAIALF